MQTKREYLVGLGLAKEGRGKFSNAAKEALAKAEADGMKFSDSSTGPVVKSSPSQPTKPQATETPYYFPDEYRYPEAEWQAYVVKEGRKVTISLRECCNTCRVSLVNHACNTPTIHNNVPVAIVGKKVVA